MGQYCVDSHVMCSTPLNRKTLPLQIGPSDTVAFTQSESCVPLQTESVFSMGAESMKVVVPISKFRLRGSTEAIFLASIFFLIVWPKYGFFSAFGLPKSSPFTLVTLLALGKIVLDAVQRRNRFPLGPLVRKNRLLVIVFATWFLIRIITDALGSYPVDSLYVVSRDLVYAAPFFIMTGLLASYKRGRERLWTVFIYGTFAVLCFALLEIVTGVNIASVIRPFVSGIDEKLLYSLSLSKLRGGGVRAQSTFDHPIVFGEYLAGVIPLMLTIFYFGLGRWQRITALLLFTASVICAYLTRSRSALIAMVLGLTVWLSARQLRHVTKQRLILILLGACLTATALSVATDSILSLVQGRDAEERASSAIRDVMWERSITPILRRPILGYGDGEGVKIGGTKSQVEEVRTLDDSYLSTLIEHGALGLVSLVALMLCIVAQLIRQCRVLASPSEAAFAASFLAMAVVVILTQRINSIPYGFTLLYIAGGYLAGIKTDELQRK
jgi:hypothetical protein